MASCSVNDKKANHEQDDSNENHSKDEIIDTLSQDGIFHEYGDAPSMPNCDKDATEEMPTVEENFEHDSLVTKPYVGMKFESVEDAYYYYNVYAKSIGFSVRKHYSHKSRKTKQVISSMLVCSKQGHKPLNNTIGSQLNNRRDIREGCNAHLFVGITNEGNWEVKKFFEAHSHCLMSPSKVSWLRSHHKMSKSSKDVTDLCNIGVGPSKIAHALNFDGKTSITPQDCIDDLRAIRENNIGKEYKNVISYFQKKQRSDQGFFYRWEMDENNVGRSIFWADGRARDNYMTFGDVVMFDTTYRTNKLQMPLASFIGVNHHMQSILFGCALLADETEESFIWLFETWLECMYDKHPLCIITDHDIAMENAICKVFPNTRHRFSIWHIQKNAIVNLKDLMAKGGFADDYNSWLKGSVCADEFEERWFYLKEKYIIPDGHWLEKMYHKRHHWVKLYLNDVFCAGAQSKQQSESINSFFDGFVNSHTSLPQFVYQYDRALQSRREAEEREDFKTLNTSANLTSANPIEAYVSKVYTSKVFNYFQKELKKTLSYWFDVVSEDCEKVVYSVYIQATEDNRKILVEYNINPTILVRCSCKKFERIGILCGHALLILSHKRLRSLPEQYILRRWTINARYTNACFFQSSHSVDGQGDITPLEQWSFHINMRKATDMSLRSREHMEIGISAINGLIERLGSLRIKDASTNQNSEAASSLANQDGQMLDVHDSTCGKSKGRPRKLQRIKSGSEISMSQPNERKCKKCFKEGHNVQ